MQNLFNIDINKIINIHLVFVKTIEKEIKGNKKTYTSLLTDGTEYVTVTEWNNSNFKNIKANKTVNIKNAFFSKQQLSQYNTQINRKNIVLEMNTTTTVEESAIIIKDNSNVKVFDIIELYQDDFENRMISLRAVILKIEQKNVNKKNVQIIHLIDENLDYSIEMDNWSIATLKPNYIYNFKYFSFKKGNECKLINNQFSEIIEIKKYKDNFNTSDTIKLKQFCVPYVEVNSFSDVLTETNFSINCIILDIIYRNTYITVKICDTLGFKVYSNIWDAGNLIGFKGSILKTFEQYKKLINLNVNLKMISKKDKTNAEKMYFSITSFSQDEIKNIFAFETLSQSSDDDEEEHNLNKIEKKSLNNDDTDESLNNDNAKHFEPIKNIKTLNLKKTKKNK